MNINIKPAWTNERVSALKQYAAAGWSASQIADELGGISRSAVIGKAKRDKIHLTDYEEKRALGKLPPARKRSAPRAASDPGRRFVCTINDLTDKTCRWPMGEPAHDMLYCGAETHGLGSYCPWHANIARAPAGRRD